MNTQIIQGQFNKKEAIELLTQLINVKINFYENKIEETESEEEKKIGKLKIKKLQKELLEIDKYVSQYKDGVELESFIEIMQKGTKTHEPINLIAGKFNPQDARGILVTLISDKINFHKIESFSSEERFGLEDETSKKRVSELIKSRENIIKITQEAEKNNKILRITSTINIRLEDNS